MITKKASLEQFFEKEISRKQLSKVYGKWGQGGPPPAANTSTNTNPNEPDGEGSGGGDTIPNPDPITTAGI